MAVIELIRAMKSPRINATIHLINSALALAKSSLVARKFLASSNFLSTLVSNIWTKASASFSPILAFNNSSAYGGLIRSSQRYFKFIIICNEKNKSTMGHIEIKGQFVRFITQINYENYKPYKSQKSFPGFWIYILSLSLWIFSFQDKQNK